MTRKTLRATTSSLLIAALAVPAPLYARITMNGEPLPACSDAGAPCLADGNMIDIGGGNLVPADQEEDIARVLRDSMPDAVIEIVPDDAPAAQAEAAPAAEPAPVEEPAVAAEEAPAAPAEEPAVAAEETAPAAEEPAVAAEAEAKPAEEPAVAAEAEAAPAEEPAVAAEAEAAPVEEPAVAAEAEAAPAEAPATAEATPAPEEQPAAMAEAETAPAEDPVKPPVTEAEVAAETPTDAAPLTEEQVTAQTEQEAAAEAATMEETQTAAAAAATQEAAPADAQVTEETITAADTRTSSQDFATSAAGEPAATEKKRGLSNLEKALIIGGGAAVVGALLSNGDKIVSNSGDRVVVDRGGQLAVLRNDDALLRQPGNDVRTETFKDGSTRTTVARQDGTSIVTIRANDGRVLRRAKVLEDGTQVLLIDDTQTFEPVDVATLPKISTKSIDYTDDREALRRALAAANGETFARRYSLSQVRNIRAVRELAPEIELRNVTFDSGSAAIRPAEAEKLAALGEAMKDAIADNPREVFLIEGHTDAVGNATYNLALSDRRAESLALALTEYFDVPPENMVIQGYGERYLKVRTADAERANRRAGVRDITPLLGEMVAAN